MSDRRFFRLATTGARMLVGTLVAAGFVVAVVTAVSVPWTSLSHEPVRIRATPEPTETVVVCDGPLLALGRQAEQAQQLSTASDVSVTVGVSEGAADPSETQLASPDLLGAEGVPVFTAEPADGARTDVAASSSATARADDLAGFAASGCRPPLLESWLVGGSGTVGAADLVLLSNPGDVAATVQLTVFGASGPTTPPGGSLVIAPGTRRIVPLAGLAPDEQSPVIRVTATGAPVQAALQTSITRTLVPGGMDQSGAIAAPEQDLVLAGIIASDVTTADGPATVLRLLSPSADTTAEVTARVVDNTRPAGEPQTIPLAAGQPVEVELGPLRTGVYTVTVAAGAPVVGSLWQATGLGAGDDFAWYTPADEIGVPTLFATPAGPPPLVTVANTSDGDVTVRIAATDGSFSTEVAVAAGTATDLRLPSRGVFLLDPGGPGIHAAVSFSAAGALAGFPVWPADAAEQPITVYP
ncbi:DUF5719 family protein [Microbacterium ulmi]|uniref:Large extracellular alpha-helical protein n=1 Tax=Microbacterium ulmi TaxID=179095 RepID=A0A7Y2Q107_9MICO|nr:DUF5719 family protein [Microbacterium ulmi]NII70382.1 hypothetical protein [Microbacterium ulmi]NNH03430.1 large extracellular alpha-helical protein [Microbacterium ulmi]